MDNRDFTTSIQVDQTPQEAFDAINNVPRMVAGRDRRQYKKTQ